MGPPPKRWDITDPPPKRWDFTNPPPKRWDILEAERKLADIPSVLPHRRTGTARVLRAVVLLGASCVQATRTAPRNAGPFGSC